MVKQISDNEIYFLIKYRKSILWRVAKRLSYIEKAWCLKVKKVSFLFFLNDSSAYLWQKLGLRLK